MPKKQIIITPVMKAAAWSTWQTIGNDIEQAAAEQGERLRGVERAEAILDADYMRTYGGQQGKEAADAFDVLCKDQSISLDDVYKALARELML